MEKSFPVILSELRKERGLSQKDAAAGLGISQALLSHYEKGIRECGHSFLIKAADYYGVTCDYLLGRSADRTGSSRLSLLMEKSVDDEKAGSGTMLKAALMLRDHLSGGTRDYGFDFDRLIILEAYRIILLEAEAGRLPKIGQAEPIRTASFIATRCFWSLSRRPSTNASSRPRRSAPRRKLPRRSRSKRWSRLRSS